MLLFDAALQVKSWQGVAIDLRGREMTAEELSVHMHGRPNSYVLSYLAGRTIVGQELLDLIQVKESFYRELWLKAPQDFVLSPGAVDLLNALEKCSIPRTIATSSEKTNLAFFTAHLQLARWFDLTQIVYDDGLRPGKPAPDIYWAAARNIHLAAVDCVVVEDAVSGVQAARAAGVEHVIGVGPAAAHEKLLASGAATVIESLRDFPRGILGI